MVLIRVFGRRQCTLIEGLKRWVLFPPNTFPDAIHMQEPQIPSVIWFRDHYEHALEQFSGAAVEVLQRPGETVYVPAGWPHLVLNLELSVAITHNYATEYPSMSRLMTAVKDAEPGLAVRFRQAVQVHDRLLQRDAADIQRVAQHDDGESQ